MVFLAFEGPEKHPEGAHPHESGSWMLVPLLVLSVGALASGYLGHWLHGFLSPVFASSFGKHAHLVPEHATFWAKYGLMLISGAISIVAILLAYMLYVREPWIPGLVRATTQGLYKALWNKWYVDELYEETIVDPLRKSGKFAVGIDDFFLDGLIWMVTVIPRTIGYALRGLQSGMLQGYAVTMVGGLAVIMLLMFWK
jgi:NADH-quinone oxidoreductase subunit L